MTIAKHFMGIVAVAALGSGCVTVGKYDAAVADAEQAKAAQNAARASYEQELAARTAERQKLQHALDDATSMNAELKSELERLGKDTNELLAAKGVLASSLDQARQRLEELRRAQAAAETRAALFREVALKLKRMVDAGDLQILLRSGRMVLVLSSDVLFDSGRTEIKPRGKQALAEISAALATVQNRRFQVAGHTDNEPIRVSGFDSNWELSAERGLRVTEFLIQSGMRPDTLSAAGYAEFDPVAANDTPQNKAKNRRIEITLQPNIDELVALPQPR